MLSYKKFFLFNLIFDLLSGTFNINAYVIATTSTTIQFSSDDSGKIREFELVVADPETTSSNAEVKLKKYVYEASATPIELTLYNNNDTDASGFDASATTKTYFSATDVGRLIRINPLLKGGSNIGGIKWAWGITKTVDNKITSPSWN